MNRDCGCVSCNKLEKWLLSLIMSKAPKLGGNTGEEGGTDVVGAEEDEAAEGDPKNPSGDPGEEGGGAFNGKDSMDAVKDPPIVWCPELVSTEHKACAEINWGRIEDTNVF